MDKITPDMIGKVVAVTVTLTNKDTPKRVTHFGNSYRGLEATDEPDTTTVSAMGRLAIYTVTSESSFVSMEHEKTDWTMRWANESDSLAVTVDVEVVE